MKQNARRRIVHLLFHIGAAALLTTGIGFPARPARAGDSAEAESLIRQGGGAGAQRDGGRPPPAVLEGVPGLALAADRRPAGPGRDGAGLLRRRREVPVRGGGVARSPV